MLLFLTLGYIIFLKTSTASELVYINASIQRPEWWQSGSDYPREILSKIKAGDKDSSGAVKVVDIKYFAGETKDWQTNSYDKTIGRIQFEISATRQGQKLFYNSQELYIGNPLVIEIGRTRMELLITNIENEKIKEDFTKKIVVAKIYDKYLEEVSFIKPGFEIKDNNGFTYAVVKSTSVEHEPFTSFDQFGKTHMEKNPWKYNLTLEIESLVEETDYRVIGYDGRSLGIGKSFNLNSPLYDGIQTKIIDIN